MFLTAPPLLLAPSQNVDCRACERHASSAAVPPRGQRAPTCAGIGTQLHHWHTAARYTQGAARRHAVARSAGAAGPVHASCSQRLFARPGCGAAWIRLVVLGSHHQCHATRSGASRGRDGPRNLHACATRGASRVSRQGLRGWQIAGTTLWPVG